MGQSLPPSIAPILLPAPADEADGSVLEALRQRRTIRAIDVEPLSLPMLSNLLWAACGVNRPVGPFGQPGLTAATASNSQEIDLYVALAGGTYRYDARAHALLPVAAEDMRSLALTPGQTGVDARAPVQLIYVVDEDRLVHTDGYQEPGLHDPEIRKSYYFTDTGLIAGNVYLFAAAEGMAAWFHNCDKPHLAEKLGLRPTQSVLFAQSVGYPAAG